MKPEEIISDEEIEQVHGDSDFGSMGKRPVVNLGCLKVACGLYQGKTAIRILKEHELVYAEHDLNLTPKGQAYLWAVFKKAFDLEETEG